MVFRLGVDGGGTKTDAILVGPDGAVAARQSGPGCNPSIVGPADARRIATELLHRLREPVSNRDPAGRVETTLLCMAGNRAFWRDFGAGLAGFGRVIAADDSLPVLELATDGRPGLVLHAGTGSFVAARSDSPSSDLFGALHYAGGLGWRFGDPGSAYDLGRDAIARGLLEMQGWLPASAVGRWLREQTGLADARAISRSFYDDPAPNPRIAGLAPGLLDLAAQGDRVAGALAAESANRLLDLCLLVAGRIFPGRALEEIAAGLSGPILTHPFVRDALARRCALRFRTITEAPIEGVRRLLARIA